MRTRLDSRFSTGRSLAEVDFVGCPAFKRRMRTMFVVPVNIRKKLVAECITAQRYEHSTSAFLFDRPDETFNDGDAAVLADGAIARRLDALTFHPASERVAIEDAVSVTDDVFWRRIGPTHRPSQKRTYGATVRRVGKDANAHDAA